MDPRDYLAQLRAMIAHGAYAEINSNCGHLGSSCEAWKVEAIVNAFL